MNYYGYPYGSRITPIPTPVMPQPSVEPPFPSGTTITPDTPTSPTQIPNFADPYNDPIISSFINRTRSEQSYVENIIRLNRGKNARVFMTFPENSRAEKNVFFGVIEGAGRDHILMKDATTGVNHLLLMVYLDYVDFPEDINYVYPAAGILNIVDEDLFFTDPYLAQLKEYEILFEQYVAEQKAKAGQ